MSITFPIELRKKHTEVSGISAVKDIETGLTGYYPIWAKHAERDNLNRPFTSTYVTNQIYTSAINDINNKIINVSSTIDYKILEINNNISSFSGNFTTAINDINNTLLNLSGNIYDTISSMNADYEFSNDKVITRITQKNGKLEVTAMQLNTIDPDIDIPKVFNS